jgi:hypothetical protein
MKGFEGQHSKPAQRGTRWGMWRAKAMNRALDASGASCGRVDTNASTSEGIE